MKTKFIPKMINFELDMYYAVCQVAREKGFGQKGFTTALRMIITEWMQLTAQPRSPVPSDPLYVYPHKKDR
jgi:hypothetical protein